MSNAFVPDSRDQRIIEIIRDLCLKLHIQKRPEKLLWVERIITMDNKNAAPIGSEQCYVNPSLGKVILPIHMRDKLEPEDWRPLIASALILKYKLKKKVWKLLVRRTVFPPLAAAIVSGFILWVTGYSSYPNWPALALVISLGAAGLAPWLFHGRFYKQARLVADRSAARIVGIQAFLDVLVKLDQMGLNDVEEEKHRNMMSWPAIDKRIHNLQQTQ